MLRIKILKHKQPVKNVSNTKAIKPINSNKIVRTINYSNNLNTEYNILINQFNPKNSIIPLNIFQTWNTLNLPKKMFLAVEKLKQQNPEFKYHLYDDTMCRNFIKDNFPNEVLVAFDKLKPGAFKADLWRLCILYKYGGIYLDIKYKCAPKFKLIYLTTKEYFVRDRVVCNQHGIYNAFIASKPNNKILLDCINKIVTNVKKKFYGKCTLEVTGPLCLNKFFTQFQITQFKLRFDGEKILFNNNPILVMYKEYRDEQNKFGNPRYTLLWEKRDIYNI